MTLYLVGEAPVLSIILSLLSRGRNSEKKQSFQKFSLARSANGLFSHCKILESPVKAGS